MEIEPRPGGFRKPISTREFILDYLAKKGEEYIAEMHRAYKRALTEIAVESARVPAYRGKGRKPILPRAKKYTYPRYHNFQGQVWKLAQEGLVELARTEPTRGIHDQFKGFDELPERHYYRLKKEG